MGTFILFVVAFCTGAFCGIRFVLFAKKHDSMVGKDVYFNRNGQMMLGMVVAGNEDSFTVKSDGDLYCVRKREAMSEEV